MFLVARLATPLFLKQKGWVYYQQPNEELETNWIAQLGFNSIATQAGGKTVIETF